MTPRIFYNNYTFKYIISINTFLEFINTNFHLLDESISFVLLLIFLSIIIIFFFYQFYITELNISIVDFICYF